MIYNSLETMEYYKENKMDQSSNENRAVSYPCLPTTVTGQRKTKEQMDPHQKHLTTTQAHGKRLNMPSTVT